MKKPLLLTIAVTLLLAPRALHAQQETPAAPPAPAPVAPATAPTPPPAPVVNVQEIAATTEKAVSKAMATLDIALSGVDGKLQNIFYGKSRLPDTKVSLDMNDMSVKDALKKVLEQAKLDYVLDDDIPDVKTSVKIKDVGISTVLDLLTQTAGVGWTSNSGTRTIQVEKDGQNKETSRSTSPVVHIGKKVVNSLFVDLTGLASLHAPKGYTFVSPPPPGARVLSPSTAGPQVYRYYMNEQRSTFTCPHCKAQTTIVRHEETPHCTTCNRVFQSDWKVCPFDGTKRPVSQNEWKYCPVCGKKVSSEEGFQNDKNDRAIYAGSSFLTEDTHRFCSTFTVMDQLLRASRAGEAGALLSLVNL